MDGQSRINASRSFLWRVSLILLFDTALSFVHFANNPDHQYSINRSSSSQRTFLSISNPIRRQQTHLNVWWFGGSSSETTSSSGNNEDSCELVAVRIERTSVNSRRIGGEIVVPKPIDDVWAILTDYDNLAIHVPNLVESKRVNPGQPALYKPQGSVQGDGRYKCRLFQKGAQNIVGFEFAATVTMDMTEKFFMTGNGSDAEANDRRIEFKCVESPFFSEFDGTWRATPTTDPDDPTGQGAATKLEYVVDVRPRGPVPVAALEWRIREDVPTNLRAVKASAIELGYDGVMELRDKLRRGRDGRVSSITTSNNTLNSMRRNTSAAAGAMGRAISNAQSNVGNITAAATSQRTKRVGKLAPVRVQWYEDETMASYLNKKT